MEQNRPSQEVATPPNGDGLSQISASEKADLLSKIDTGAYQADQANMQPRDGYGVFELAYRCGILTLLWCFATFGKPKNLAG